MARTLNPQDAYALINALNAQMNGSASLTATDGSSFVAVGETLLQAGTENVLNALGLVLGRTFMAVRPYSAKFGIINTIDTGLFAGRMRKISFYSRAAEQAGFENTQINPENLKAGVDNTGSSSSGHERAPSMWLQNPAVPLSVEMGGSSVWQSSMTIYEVQLQKAFRSEADFNDFVAGMMTEMGNDITQYQEAMNRNLVLNYIAGKIAMNVSGTVINLTSLYNSTFGTSFSTSQLQTTYLESFLKFFVEQVQVLSDRMTHRTTAYHWAPAKSGYQLLRHTPKDRQRLMLYNPFMVKARAYVMPSIFGPGYLDINNYEGVDYWQSFNSPAAINFTPAILETDTSDSDYGTQVTASKAVSESYILGVLYDVDALMVQYELDYSASSPLEASKLYRNLIQHWRRNYICDYTENGVVFIMADPAT